jgi:hypothetical protein
VLVLTGVSTPADLLAAPPHRRPTYVASDMSGLLDVDGPVRLSEEDGGVAGWTVSGDPPSLTGEGRPQDALAVLCAAAWRTPSAQVAAGSPAARKVLDELGLATSA